MNIKDATELLKVIADESRLRIIKTLAKEKKVCGNDLLVKVDCKQATLSHHMSVLVDAGLVKAKRDGNKVFYSLIRTDLESLATFLVGEKVQTKVVEVVVEKKVEKVVEVEKPALVVEQAKPIVKPVEEKKEEKRPTPVSISVPIYLL